jgi:hypothetical protein
MIKAIKNINKAEVESLLKKGANPNLKIDRVSLLFYTIFEDYKNESNDYREISLLLIQYGANVNYKDWWDYTTPLRYAVANNQYDVAEALLKKGADVNAVSNPDNTYQDTPVFELGSRGFRGTDNERAAMLRLLNRYHADLNFIDEYNNTLISWLIFSYTWPDRKYPETIKAAVQMGATEGVLVALQLNDEETIVEVLRLLKDGGLDFNVPYSDQKDGVYETTFLEYAELLKSSSTIVAELKELGAQE